MVEERRQVAGRRGSGAWGAGAVALAAALAAQAAAAAGTGATPAARANLDWLDLAAGAIVLSATSEYDDKRWSALGLIDGLPDVGWASTKGHPRGNVFVIELRRPVRLERFVIDTREDESERYPGISARAFRLSGKARRGEPWRMLLEGKARAHARSVFEVPPGPAVRLLRLEVLDNHGRDDYVEIMELEAYGRPEGPEPANAPVAGVYDTNYNLLRLHQTGDRLVGCYDWDHGRITGRTDGRVIRAQWFEDGNQHGTALFVLDSTGERLSGVWYENGELQGSWRGTRVRDGRRPQCELPAEGLCERLALRGSDIAYGIRFAHDSAELAPASTETLSQILAVLKANPGVRLRIEGHTDATGGELYNLALSQRRAETVRAWLVAHGVASARLEARGFGESRPVADNATPQGRALNRRVEIHLVGGGGLRCR